MVSFSRTWCVQVAPYWILTPRSTGIRSRRLKAAPPICCTTSRNTPTPWHRTLGKRTWNPSPSSLTTWVSAIITFCVNGSSHIGDIIFNFCLRVLFSLPLLQFWPWITWMCRIRRGRRCLGSRTSRRNTPKSLAHPSTSRNSTSALIPTEVGKLQKLSICQAAKLKTCTKKNPGQFISCYLLPVEPTPALPTQTDAQQEEEQTVSDRKRRYLEPAAPLPVAVVIVYKTLGKLLPERYDPDRRSMRYTL